MCKALPFMTSRKRPSHVSVEFKRAFVRLNVPSFDPCVFQLLDGELWITSESQSDATFSFGSHLKVLIQQVNSIVTAGGGNQLFRGTRSVKAAASDLEDFTTGFGWSKQPNAKKVRESDGKGIVQQMVTMRKKVQLCFYLQCNFQRHVSVYQRQTNQTLHEAKGSENS